MFLLLLYHLCKEFSICPGNNLFSSPNCSSLFRLQSNLCFTVECWLLCFHSKHCDGKTGGLFIHYINNIPLPRRWKICHPFINLSETATNCRMKIKYIHIYTYLRSISPLETHHSNELIISKWGKVKNIPFL